MICFRRAALSLILGLFCAALVPGQKQQGKNESGTDYYRKWVEEDVVYIISPEEKSVFGKLTTLEEKETFIEQFWLRRDPDPRTSANEFKEEHYRRLQYANERFASGKPGWRTDRGRFYIRFGKPDEVESHPGGPYTRKPYEGGGMTSVYPFEKWRYRHIEGIGNNVEVEFVDSSMSGNYELALDAEEKDAFFNVPGWGPTNDEVFGRTSRNDRVQYRFWGNPNNLDKGETKFAYQRLEDRFYNRFEQLRLLEKPPILKNPKLREVVAARVLYPASLPFTFHQAHYRLGEEEYLVPISLKLQNRDLSYARQPDGSLVAKVDLYARVTGIDGTIHHEFDDSVYSQYSPEDFPKRDDHYSVYQKMLRLRPGRYKLDLLIQSDEGRKSTLNSYGFVLPSVSRDSDGLQLSPVILSRYITLVLGGYSQSEPFVIGDIKVVPAFENVFGSNETIGVYLQVYGFRIDPSSKGPDLMVRFQIRSRDGRVLRNFLDERGTSLRSGGNRMIVAELLNPTRLPKGSYSLVVTVEDRVSGESQSQSADVEISG